MASVRGTLTSVFPGADPAVLQEALQFFQRTDGPNQLNQWTNKLIARPALQKFIKQLVPSHSLQIEGLTVQLQPNVTGIFYEFQRWFKENQGSGHTYIAISGLHFYVITTLQSNAPLIMTYMNFSNNWDNTANVLLHQLATKLPVRLLSGFPVPEVENLFRLFACLQGVPLDFINSHLGDAGYSEKLLEFQLFTYFHLMTTSPFIEGFLEELAHYRDLLEPNFLPLRSGSPEEETPKRKRKRGYD
jgi:hypothetical protein